MVRRGLRPRMFNVQCSMVGTCMKTWHGRLARGNSRQNRGETPLRLAGKMPVLRPEAVFIHVLRPWCLWLGSCFELRDLDLFRVSCFGFRVS